MMVCSARARMLSTRPMHLLDLASPGCRVFGILARELLHAVGYSTVHRIQNSLSCSVAVSLWVADVG